VDCALNAPIPWKASDCLRAATVHLGGSFEEIAASEKAVRGGEHSDRPFVLLAQPSLFDNSRAPAGKHTAWAYCHVPNGSKVNMVEKLEDQLERVAPGFRDCILARRLFSSRSGENAREPGGWRYWRWDSGYSSSFVSPNMAPLCHVGARYLPLFSVYSARGRSAWHVRLSCGEDGIVAVGSSSVKA
jgi:hypothetical protein